MCLQQSTSSTQRSEVYLYQRNTVTQGTTVSGDTIPCNVRSTIESSGLGPNEIMSTHNVNIRGISYSSDDVLVLSKEDEPAFGIINKIFIVEHMKYMEVTHLNITNFNSNINSFECMKSDQKSTAFMI